MVSMVPVTEFQTDNGKSFSILMLDILIIIIESKPIFDRHGVQMGKDDSELQLSMYQTQNNLDVIDDGDVLLALAFI